MFTGAEKYEKARKIVDERGNSVIDESGLRLERIIGLQTAISGFRDFQGKQQPRLDELKAQKPSIGTEEWKELTRLRGILYSEGFVATRAEGDLPHEEASAKNYANRHLDLLVQAGVEMAQEDGYSIIPATQNSDITDIDS